MLWQIVDTPHRILGSFHVRSENSPLPRWAATSHHGMERFVFEADVLKQPLTIGLDTSGAHLAFPGAAQMYARTDAFLRAMGFTDTFAAYQPWRAAMYVGLRMIQHHGFSDEAGIDRLLRNHADQKGFRASFLESPVRAFEILHSACSEPKEGLRYLERTLSDALSGRFHSEFQRCLNAWLANDLSDLAAIHQEKMVEFPAVFEAFITKRNREWVPVARRLIPDKKPTLFVVGALHTVGSESFLDLLNREGNQFARLS